MKYTLFLVAAVFLSTAQGQKFTDPVSTHSGYIKGRKYETVWHSMPYSAFLGVPYAKPPIGDLRFKDPEEPYPWRGVRKTIEETPACIHLLLHYPFGKEDCLYLHVYTPEMNFKNVTKLRPVMFWIFGGGYQAGSAHRFAYNPDFLLEEDVVFVSLNYRLGALGFLALGHNDARGNQGLKDMILALKWVRKNIANFGGDPDNVTLFGESAGGVGVGNLMCSPLARDLFHKAILQSATPVCPWAYLSPKDSLDHAFNLGRRMNIYTTDKEELLHRLKQADVKDIITASSTMISIFLPFPIFMPFVGTIETVPSNNTFMSECPITTMQTGKCKNVPVLLGFNEHEMIVFAEALLIGRQLAAKQITRVTTPILRKLGQTLVDTINPVANMTIWEMIRVASLQNFNVPVDITQRYFVHHNHGNPVYYYHLAYDTEYNFHKILDPNVNGTSHGDDLNLLFHFFINSPTDPENEYNKFRKKICAMWANFAKYGDPTPDENLIGIRWLHSGPEGLQLEIGNNEFRMRNRVIDKEGELIGQALIEQLRSPGQCRRVVNNPPNIYGDVIQKPSILEAILPFK